MPPKIAIIGAGNVGSTLALFLAQKELADLVLFDVVEGLAQGKALDLKEAFPLWGIDIEILGTNSYRDIKGAQLVAITAGAIRQPGMDRLGLLKKNASVVKEIVENICKYAPEAIILMVTNPLDVMTYYALKLSGFEKRRVLGQAGVLDGARFAYFISERLKVSAKNIQALVLGGHAETMLPLPKYTTVNGVSILKLMDGESLLRVIERTKRAGEEIISLLKTASAYYSPAASTAYMVEAILKDRKAFCCASVYLEGEYGLHDICLGVPVKLGKDGVEEIIELELEAEEKEALRKSAEIYRKSIQELLPF